MDIGSKVLIIKEICANDLKNPHLNKTATVLEVDRLGLIKVSIDDFPPCNHREYHNKFYYTMDEITTYNPMKLVKTVEMPVTFING